MAARLTKRLADQTRDAIKTSMLINRLSDHVDGKVELAPTQVTAALGLLRKTIPDLKSTEHSGPEGKDLFPEKIVVEVVRPPERTDPTES